MPKRNRYHAWILWVGTAAAMQSAGLGNVGPFGSWDQRATFADREQCIAGRGKAVADYLKENPTAVARKADLVYDKKPGVGDDTTIVHSALRFMCRPANATPPSFADPSVPAAPGGAAPPANP